MLGDLHRFRDGYVRTCQDSAVSAPITTNSLIENRFRILKYIALSGRTQRRIDEFSEILKEQTIIIQKKAVIECLKTKPRSLKRRKSMKRVESDLSGISPAQIKKTQTSLTESWNKKGILPDNIKSKKQGKYQKPPETKLELKTEKDSPVENLQSLAVKLPVT